MNLPHPLPPAVHRGGTILILVAGVSALLASLALAFMARMRSDVEESALVIQYAQAKIMLAAACNYVQETSRLGWDRWNTGAPSTLSGQPIHDEGFGWVDVRDGSVGPNDRFGAPVRNMDWTTPRTEPGSKPGEIRPVWPAINGVVRCPMHVMKVPPYATQLTVAYNPIDTDPTSPDYCYPLLKHPDPQPQAAAAGQGNHWTATAGASGVTNAHYAQWAAGNRTPRPQTVGKSWFRIMRDGPSTFLVTCGAGGTHGYRTWYEVTTANDAQRFGTQAFFEQMRLEEQLLWYRIEWSAAVMEPTNFNLHVELGIGREHYLSIPANQTHAVYGVQLSGLTQNWTKNPVGTIRWIERLITEPANW